ncbi:MAG: hypothetical protein NVS1B11_32910 [Terriglobales bacterium]
MSVTYFTRVKCEMRLTWVDDTEVGCYSYMVPRAHIWLPSVRGFFRDRFDEETSQELS